MKVKSLIILSLMFVFVSVSFAVTDYDVYGVLTETFLGGKYGGKDSGVFNSDSVDFFQWNSLKTEPIKNTADVLEGKECTKCQADSSAGGGAGITFVNSSNSETQQDMSAFYNGQLKFCVKINEVAAADFPVGIKLSGYNIVFKLSSATVFSGFDSSKIGQWQEVSLNLNSTTDSRITKDNMKRTSFLFLISYSANNISTSSILNIDNIRWEKENVSTGMSLSLLNVEDNKKPDDGKFSFNVDIDVDLEDTNWKASDQYVKIDFNGLKFSTTSTVSYYSPSYIRVYTNNTQYTGKDTHAGLINDSDTSSKLNACWRISTYTISKDKLKIYQEGDTLTDDLNVKPLFNCFLWMQDWNELEKEQDIEKIEYSRIWNTESDPNKRGFQFNEANFSSGGFPVYLYLGANFANASPGSTYTTNTLTIELIYEK